MNIEPTTQNQITDTEKIIGKTTKTMPTDIMPKGKLLGILMDNVEHAIEPVGTLHQFVKNSINTYPKVGDLTLLLT